MSKAFNMRYRDKEVDEEAQEVLEEAQQRVSLLLPSLDVLGEKNECKW